MFGLDFIIGYCFIAAILGYKFAHAIMFKIDNSAF